MQEGVNNKAWEWIEKEDDERVLKILLASIMLLRIPNYKDMIDFVPRALFENRDITEKIKYYIYH